jgi:GNAT superfamily N-acetyltransferase
MTTRQIGVREAVLQTAGMWIRAPRADELGELQAIELAAGVLFRDVGMPEIADAAPPLVEELERAAAVLVAVDDGDRPIGYARVELVDGHAHLEQLSVHPDHGRQGIGTALLDAVATWARARGDSEVTLTTFRDVPFNAPLYARRGYEIVPVADRGPGLVEQMRVEAEHGLDPATRVAMRRLL